MTETIDIVWLNAAIFALGFLLGVVVHDKMKEIKSDIDDYLN